MKDIFNKFITNFRKSFEETKNIKIPTPEAPKTPMPEKSNIPTPVSSEKIEIPKFKIDKDWMIPIGPQSAVSVGWTYTDGKPLGVTWHWAATWTRNACDRVIGGSDAERAPQFNPAKNKYEGGASAHFCVGKDFKESISQYVDLENRSWHAGSNQTLRWDGKKVDFSKQSLTGSRTTIGIETTNIGFAREKVEKKPDWIEVWSTNGEVKMFVQPWNEEQIEMMIYLGKMIVTKYPNIKPEDHHGHMDICPGYKEDCSFAFPFAKVLSGIYEKEITDIWTPFRLVKNRQAALIKLGYNLGSSGADGDWGRLSEEALLKFQKDRGMVANEFWSTFVCREIHKAYLEKGLEFKF